MWVSPTPQFPGVPGRRIAFGRPPTPSLLARQGGPRAGLRGGAAACGVRLGGRRRGQGAGELAAVAGGRHGRGGVRPHEGQLQQPGADPPAAVPN